MKKIYTVLVYEYDTTRIEKLLNVYRVGLNDWDRTKVFELNGERVVNYTIACTEDVYKTIRTSLYNV